MCTTLLHMLGRSKQHNAQARASRPVSRYVWRCRFFPPPASKVRASNGARFEASVMAIRQGNGADLFCSDAGGLLDVLAAAVGADGPATDCPASGTVTFMVRLKNKNLN